MRRKIHGVGTGEAGRWARIAIAWILVATFTAVEATPDSFFAGGSGWGCIGTIDNPDPTYFDWFGAALAWSDGHLFIGAPGDDDAGPNAGAVYVWHPGDDELEAKLLPPMERGGQNLLFGGDLAAGGPPGGEFVAVGRHWVEWTKFVSSEPPAVHIIDVQNLAVRTLFEEPTRPRQLGQPVTVAANEQWVAIGLPGSYAANREPHPRSNGLEPATMPSGRVVVVDAINGEIIADFDPPGVPTVVRSGYGIGLALQEDRVLIGDPLSAKAGEVLIHGLPGGELLHHLAPSDPTVPFKFGGSVAASADRIAIGLINSRAVEHYEGNPPVHVATTHGRPTESAQFGRELLFIDDELGSRLLASHGGWGLWADWRNYQFDAGFSTIDIDSGAVTERAFHDRPRDMQGFGYALAHDESSGLLAVGAPREADGGRQSGRAYLYGPSELGSEVERRCASRVSFPPCGPMTTADADEDGDGLTREAEERAGTSPCTQDTDRDHLLDVLEVAEGFDPLSNDTDNDGMPDGRERILLGTDPARADTDGDGFDDGCEVQQGSDPLDALSMPLPPTGGRCPLPESRDPPGDDAILPLKGAR